MIQIPTIAQLRISIKADLESQYGGTLPAFGKVFLNAVVLVQAAKLKIYYLLLGKVQKNIFVDTADPERQGGTLERFGRVKLGRDPFPPIAGQYVVEVTGTIGAVIAAGTIFKSNDDSVNPGKLFILDTEFELETETDEITVRALQAGVDSQMEAGEFMTATAPILNVETTVEVVSESVEPFAGEDIEEYRLAVIESFRLEPNGGSAGDYRIWASDATGVRKVYPYATPAEVNQVDLYVEATVADSDDGKGTPSGTPGQSPTGLLADVKAVVEFDPDTSKTIEDRARKPLTVIVNYLPITPLNVDITITNFQDLTTEKETLIAAALAELVFDIRPFVAAADVVEEKNDILDQNKIANAILNAVPGAIFNSPTLEVDSVIVTTYTFENGDIPHMNSVDINP